MLVAVRARILELIGMFPGSNAKVRAPLAVDKVSTVEAELALFMKVSEAAEAASGIVMFTPTGFVTVAPEAGAVSVGDSVVVSIVTFVEIAVANGLLSASRYARVTV